MQRRDFLRRIGLTTAAVAAGAKVLATPEESPAVQPTGELEDHNIGYCKQVYDHHHHRPWFSLYDNIDIDLEVWQELYDKYEKISAFDMLSITKP
jgi:hypothetical protein